MGKFLSGLGFGVMIGMVGSSYALIKYGEMIIPMLNVSLEATDQDWRVKTHKVNPFKDVLFRSSKEHLDKCAEEYNRDLLTKNCYGHYGN